MAHAEHDEFASEPQAGDRRPGLPFDPGRSALSVRRDWRWIPIAAAIWGALGLVIAFQYIKHTFSAQTVLVWEPRGDGGPANERQLVTEAGSLKLPETVRKVRQRLALSIPVDVLQAQIEIGTDSRSNLVRIDATGPSAHDAALIANTVAQVFLEQQTQSVRKQAEESLRVAERDSQVVRRTLTQARAAYAEFQREHAVADVQQELHSALAGLTTLTSDEQHERANLESLTSQVASLQEPRRTPLEPTPIRATLAEKLDALEADLTVAKLRFAPDDSRIAILEQQIAALRKRVANGQGTPEDPRRESIATAAANARTLRAGSAARLKSIQAALLDLQKQIERYRSLEEPARALLASIEPNERRIEELESQMARAQQLAYTPRIEWRVLTAAVDAESPERSMRRAIVASMPLLGMLFALLALCVRPLLDGRVYTAREAAYWSRAPVLGSTRWPHTPHTPTLARELMRDATLAQGSTLVVGATRREEPYAQALAAWLRHGGAEPMGRTHVATTHSATPSAIVQHAQPTWSIQRAGDVTHRHDQDALARFHAGDETALRSAARLADRVIVLLTSGEELFTSVAAIRTRLGRERGIGLVLLAMRPDLIALPDRSGDVDAFWSTKQQT